MARPVKWSRDVHLIRERAALSRTETWSRQDIEMLFGVGRASAQTLMRVIGELQIVGGAHFVERTSLLDFLNAIIAAPSIEEGLRTRTLDAQPPPRSKPLRISIPDSLRSLMIPDLPPNIMLARGRIEITANSAVSMMESLVTLALVMQNDLDRFRTIIDPPYAQTPIDDDELRSFLAKLRAQGSDSA